MCNCRGGHVQLRGMCPEKKIPWTQVAEPYPRGLCRMLAAALCTSVGWAKPDKLNVAQCARCASARIGEASNPGPRPRRGAQRFSLEEVQTVSASTLAVQARMLNQFLTWCSTTTGDAEFEAVFHKVPSFLPCCLRSYGDLMFQSGGSLFNLRHLLLAAQRWCPGAKPFMQTAWNMVERWELQAPVVHRTPMPESLLKAMCVVAWHRRWFSWVGVTLLAFYGAGRLGEVPYCRRSDLVLPDDLGESGHVVFLQLRRFKSLRRVAARVQHMKIADVTAVKVITKIFKLLPYDSALFNQNAYQYRKRWDLLMSDFEIPKDSGLTPGGLRGGAAVYHYKQGKPIGDLLWLMRLRSQITLESYLQEVAAMNALATLPASSRTLIKDVAATFSFLPLAAPDQG